MLYWLKKYTISSKISRGVAYHPIIDILKASFDIHEGDDDFNIKEMVKSGLKILGADEATTLPYLLELLAIKDRGIVNLFGVRQIKSYIDCEELKIVFLEVQFGI